MTCLEKKKVKELKKTEQKMQLFKLKDIHKIKKIIFIYLLIFTL